MKCHACAHDNADSALFCTACRRPLVAPAKLPTRLEPLAAAPGEPALSAAVVARTAAAAAPPAVARDRYAPPDAVRPGSAEDEDPNAVLTDEDAWAAVIGTSNTDYYLLRFERLSRGEGANWHWPGMLLTWYWMLYRKLWVPALVYFFVPGLVGVAIRLSGPVAPLLSLVWWLAVIVGPGVLANRWYFRHCTKKIADVRAHGGSRTRMLARLEAVGGTSGVAIVIAVFGFIAVVGILAAVAIPAYQTYVVKAKVSEAVLQGAEVARTVGRQYEQTGALPSDDDVARWVAQAPRPSPLLREAHIDGRTGVLRFELQATPSVHGTLLMIPSTGNDGGRHLTWTCATDDLTTYVPATCRNSPR